MASEIEFVVKMLRYCCKTRRPYAALLLLLIVLFKILYRIKGSLWNNNRKNSIETTVKYLSELLNKTNKNQKFLDDLIRDSFIGAIAF